MTEQDIIERFTTSEYWNFFGFEYVSCTPEEAVIRLPYRQQLNNTQQTVHGGVYMSIMDTAMGMLVLARGANDATTIQMVRNFLKPAIEDTIIAKASIIKEMRSTALLKGELYNESRDMLAYYTATFRTNK